MVGDVPRQLAAFVFAVAVVAEFAGGALGLGAAATAARLAAVLVAASAAVARWSPWRPRPGAGKSWAALAPLQARLRVGLERLRKELPALRAEVASLRVDWRPPPLHAIWDRVVFRDARRLIAIKRERKLVADDVPAVASGQRRREIHSSFKYDVNENLFLLRALLRAVWPSLLPMYIADALVQAIEMGVILLEGYILHCMDASAEHAWYHGHVAALLLVLLRVAQSRVDDALTLIGAGWSNVGEALAIEFMRLPLTNAGLRKRAPSSVVGGVDLLLADMRRIQSVLISVPIIAASAWSVFGQVGWLALVPLVVPTLLSLLGVGFAALTGSRRRWQERHYGGTLEHRIHGISRSIRTVKLFGWERVFVDPELQTGRRAARALPWYAPAARAVWYAIESVQYATSQISAGLLIYAYAHTNHGAAARPITNADLFRVSGLVWHLRSQVEQLATRVRGVQDLVRRYNRIERYLRGEFVATLPRTPVPAAGQAVSVAMEGCSFVWDPKAPATPVLRDVSLAAGAGELVAVVGKTGAGKTSLMLAVCSELEMTAGAGGVVGSVAYLEQSPWIMNSSLRENILFGRAFDQPLYDKVIRACAFADDLATWPDGDLTVIGDRGINISGGQRARLALARTLYTQADIYVLDDPLSAVDAHVKRHILEHVILDSGLLAGKLRIVATHTKHVVPFAHQIVTVDDGRATVVRQTPQVYRAAADTAEAAEDEEAPPTAVDAAAETSSKKAGSDEDEDGDGDGDGDDNDDDGKLKKWSLVENFGYIVRLCGVSAIATVMLTGLVEPITSFVMDGYVLDALRADSDSVGGDIAGMLRYIALTMASEIVQRTV
ncbi:hypothetical protein IWQ57_002942, partial [Coemansia nantahalensis]